MERGYKDTNEHLHIIYIRLVYLYSLIKGRTQFSNMFS